MRRVGDLIYYSLVAGLSAGVLFQSITVVRNSLAGKPTLVMIHTPFEMYVEFPLLLVWGLTVLTWTVVKVVRRSAVRS